jgi:hypothetical protein
MVTSHFLCGERNRPCYFKQGNKGGGEEMSHYYYEPKIWKTWHVVDFPVTIGGIDYESIRPLMKMVRKAYPWREWKVKKYTYYGAFWEIKYNVPVRE